MWLWSSNLWPNSNSWINIDSFLLPNLNNILELVLVPIPVILELKSPISESHSIVGKWMWNRVSTFWFGPTSWTNLDSWTFTWLQSFSWVDYSHALPESRSIIPSFHTPFWDRGIDNNDSEISLKIWKLDRENFLIKIIHIYIILVGYIREVSGGFLWTRKLDWATFRKPIRPLPEPPP